MPIQLRDVLVERGGWGDHQHAAVLGRALAERLIQQDTRVAVSDLGSEGTWKPHATQETKDGYILWAKAAAGPTARRFDTMDKLVAAVLTARRG